MHAPFKFLSSPSARPMEEFIVASHISSVANYPPSTVTIQTVRQHLPLPRTPVNSIPTEHAIFASTIDHEITGTIGLRLIHGGLIIELVSLSHSVSPLRLIFPSLVMESPAVFLWEDTELHVLAVTESGSLYRIVVPIQGTHLWERDLERVWPREYLIRHMPEDTEGCMVHVQGPHCMAISTKGGSLLRLESESLGYDSQDGKLVDYNAPRRLLTGNRGMDRKPCSPQHVPFHLCIFYPNTSNFSAQRS